MTTPAVFLKIKNLYMTRWYFSLIIIFLALMIFLVGKINNKRYGQADFEVYYKAASRLMHSENLYRGDIDGHFKYKYSPTAAIYFIPFAIFPFVVAKTIFYFLMTGIVCYGFYLCMKLAHPEFLKDLPWKTNNIILLSALALGVCIERELDLGQVNHLLMVLYLIIITLMDKKKSLAASIIWAATVFIKPFGFIFFPYLLIKGQFKTLGYFLLTLAILAVAPAIFIGFNNLPGQYQNWFRELSVELSAKQGLLADANHSIFSLLARYTPIRLINFTPESTRIFQLAIMAIIGVIFLFLYLKGCKNPRGFVLDYSILIGLIPLLSYTSYNAYGFMELAIVLLMVNFARLSKPLRTAAIVGFVFAGINMHDLVGRTIWNILHNASLIGVGAVISIAVLGMMRVKKIA
jgi:hypothetical protein